MPCLIQPNNMFSTTGHSSGRLLSKARLAFFIFSYLWIIMVRPILYRCNIWYSSVKTNGMLKEPKIVPSSRYCLYKMGHWSELCSWMCHALNRWVFCAKDLLLSWAQQLHLWVMLYPLHELHSKVSSHPLVSLDPRRSYCYQAVVKIELGLCIFPTMWHACQILSWCLKVWEWDWCWCD